MSDEGPQATRERVLVVEDNEHASFLLKSLLERAGFDVVVSPDGRDAIAKLSSLDPVDAVVLDLMLPYVSGYQVLIEARKHPAWRAVPIVVSVIEAGGAHLLTRVTNHATCDHRAAIDELVARALAQL